MSAACKEKSEFPFSLPSNESPNYNKKTTSLDIHQHISQQTDFLKIIHLYDVEIDIEDDRSFELYELEISQLYNKIILENNLSHLSAQEQSTLLSLSYAETTHYRSQSSMWDVNFSAFHYTSYAKELEEYQIVEI
ncbi:MAG: hypothetical protein OHK0053_14800 [Microscillaceae bacterium]